MPVILKKHIGDAVLLLWKITETEGELKRLASTSDIASSERYSSSPRRMHHLAWRAALRSVCPGGHVLYREHTGAPYIQEGPHVSAAHAGDAAAVMVSPRPCAVDVEHADRDFSRAAPRYISESESRLPDGGRKDFPAAVWCAKEAMYKYSERTELSLLDDIRIVSSDLARGSMEGFVGDRRTNINIVRCGGYIIAYII